MNLFKSVVIGGLVGGAAAGLYLFGYVNGRSDAEKLLSRVRPTQTQPKEEPTAQKVKFNQLIEELEVVAFDHKWHNATGYFDGAAAYARSASDPVAAMDDSCRWIIIWNNQVLLQRYTGGNTLMLQAFDEFGNSQVSQDVDSFLDEVAKYLDSKKA